MSGSRDWFGWLPGIVIAAGVLVRFSCFLENYALSIDDAAIARNLIDRSWPGLFQPLDYAQVAPLGFLMLEKAVVSLAGSGEHALRLIPLCFGVATVYLTWSVARRLLPFVPAVCAAGLVASNSLLIDYSVRVKHYSADTAATLLVILLAIEVTAPAITHRRRVVIGLLGALLPLISFAVVFVLAGAALTVGIVEFRNPERHHLVKRLRPPILWGLGALAGLLLSRASMTATDAEYMKWFWSAYFVPIPPKDLQDLFSVAGRLEDVFGNTGRLRASLGWIALSILGVWSLHARGRRDLAAILMAPLALVISAAMLRQYPLGGGRVTLFLVPLLFLLACEGAAFGQAALGRVSRRAAVLPILLVVLLGFYSAWKGPKMRGSHDATLTLQHITTHWRLGDHVYVYYAAGQAFSYYAPRYDLHPSDYTIGSCSRGSGLRYLQELDRFRGRERVWIVIVGAATEPDVLMTYLNAIGTRSESFGVSEPQQSEYWGGIFGYRYDLTHSSRAAAVSPETFELPEDLRSPTPFPWTCYGVFTPATGA